MISEASIRIIASCVAAIAISMPTTAHGVTIPEAKQLADGAGVTLSAKIVTYASTSFFYVQEANSGTGLSNAPTGGIRVNKAAHGFAVGARLSLSGAMRTNDKLERYIECASATTATGYGNVVPWMMDNRSVGGINAGLLVKTTGFVNYVEPNGAYVYVDDGSVLHDGNTLGPLGSTVIGVRVVLPASVTRPKTTQYISVTGVSSLETVAGSPARAILAQAIVRHDSPTLMSDMNMLCVPGGGFLMGNSGVGDDALDGYGREFPQHPVYVPTFWISKSEVTRGQYRSFISAGGYSNSAYWSGEGWGWKLLLGRTQPDYWATTQTWQEYLRPDLSIPTFTQNDALPVVGVSYYEAEAFCRWAGGRLPTEAEWEKAARWDGTPRIYPWGNETDKTRCNDWYDTTYMGYQTAPVVSFSSSASPYGCLGMGGNVWEWTQDWYKSYPGSDTSFDRTGAARSVRGGGWYGVYGERCASRWFAAPGSTDNDIGFRLAR